MGLGTSFSLINYYFKKIEFDNDSIIDSTQIKYRGNLLGFPLIFGVEKEVLKRIKIFGEIYPLFYGLLNLKWKENQQKREKDFLISGGHPFYFQEEGKFGKMTIGIKYEW